MPSDPTQIEGEQNQHLRYAILTSTDTALSFLTLLPAMSELLTYLARLEIHSCLFYHYLQGVSQTMMERVIGRKKLQPQLEKELTDKAYTTSDVRPRGPLMDRG